MKVFGHPLHIMLIHFPTALLPMDFVCSVLAGFLDPSSFVPASFYAMAGGVVMGWVAITFGLFDLGNISPDKPALIKKALVHGGINTTVIIIYTVIAFIKYKQYPALQADSIALLITKGGLLICMFAGNYFGGELILKHRIAIEDNDERN